MIFDQSEYNIRCEWGPKGATLLAPISDAIIIVDVLSFSTAVEIATSQGAIIYPYRWPSRRPPRGTDETAHQYARSVAAEVAGRGNEKGYSLSPASLLALPYGIRLVLPSPNGSEISLSTGPTPTIAGCLRNCQAVAEYAMSKGRNIAVVPAGERWEDGSLRPCLEDLIGAGAIIRHLRGTRSPEAMIAVAAFESGRSRLPETIEACGSGKEKLSRGEAIDLRLASAIDSSGCVPVLTDRAYKMES